MIDNFKQAFQEEAREILVELEATLLELGESPADSELVSRAFRALHTIKGSGSMFGFDELAAFSHNLENAFDEVRNGRLEITSELINLSLVALDQIKILVDQTAVDAAISSDILEKLRALTGVADAHPAEAAAPEAVATAAVAAGAPRDWQVHFSPGPDFMRNGTNPMLLISELKQ